MKKPHQKAILQTASAEYGGLIGGIAELLEAARRTTARTVNALMTATYWEIGRRIVEIEQQGKDRAGYGEQLLDHLSADLTSRFGRGFGRRNLFQIRAFYLAYRSIVQTSSAQLVKEQTLSAQSGARILSTPSIELRRPKSQTPSGQLAVRHLSAGFPLPWSHYAAALGQECTRTRVLSRRGAAGWLERAPARSPDCLAILRTHRCLTKHLLCRFCQKLHSASRLNPIYVARIPAAPFAVANIAASAACFFLLNSSF